MPAMSEIVEPGCEEVKIPVLPGRRISRQSWARMVNRSTKTTVHWAMKGWGPKLIRVGGRVFHDYDECLAMARGEKPIKPDAV